LDNVGAVCYYLLINYERKKMDNLFDSYDGSDEAWADPAEQEDWVDTDLFYESVSDSDALISIGWGTDEDYGYYGE
jgi:hypothetical protein